jgi:alkylglycerol monooxygenase
MEYIALAIPLFFLLIGLELAWSAWKGRKVYRFNDGIANLGCGIGSQVVGAFTKTVVFAVYLYLYDNWRLFTLENSMLTWLITFLLVDLLYYWFHRLSHEVNFLWAAHIVHHQSEEYNLSVALRQSWCRGCSAFGSIHPSHS